MNSEAFKEQGTGKNFALWSGMLGPPVVWFFNLQLLYALVQVACANHRTGLLFVVTLAASLSVGVLGIVALRCFRASEGRADDQLPELTERNHFMSQLGLASSGLFAFAVIAQGIAILFVNPCLH